MTGLNPIIAPRAVLPEALAPAAQAAAGGFGRVLAETAGAVEGLGRQSAEGIERFLSGEGQEVHQVILATQKAELAFDLFLQVRNKVVQAYQEVMRMQF